MVISSFESNGTAVLVLHGRVDAADVRDLSRVLIETITRRNINMLLDLGMTSSMDGSFGQALLNCAQIMQGMGGDLSIVTAESIFSPSETLRLTALGVVMLDVSGKSAR